jgi:hypothetical protein
LISNGSPVACGGGGAAVVSATGVGTGASAAAWLCATAVVELEEESEELSAGVDVATELGAAAADAEGEKLSAGADVAAALDASAAEEDDDEDEATEADPEATILTASPALLVVLPSTNPADVNVAESTLTVLVLLLGATTPDAGAPPATTVTATVCMVLATGALLMEPSWKDAAWGACMGKAPAGHAQRQLQAPFAAAAVAAAEDPVPATTVTAEPATLVVDAPARPAGIRLAEFTKELEEEDEAAAAEAVLFPEPEPATTVTGPAAAAAVAALAVEEEELFDADPEPAWTVIVAPTDKAAALAELLDDAVPLPAWTVTAAAGAPAALAEPLAEALTELEVPFVPACMVTALPTAVVVVAAASPSAVKVAELIAAALADVELDAACTPADGAPPADTVTAAATVPLAADELSDSDVENPTLAEPAAADA